MTVLNRSGISTFAMATALAAAGWLAAGTDAQAQQKVRWQVPMAFASTLTALGDTMPYVADQLRRASGGAIDLQVFEPGTLIPALSVFENVSAGNMDAGYSWMGYEWGQVPATALRKVTRITPYPAPICAKSGPGHAPVMAQPSPKMSAP